jgi:hypothetical protein
MQEHEQQLAELQQICDIFESDRNLDRFAEGVTRVAESMGRVPWDVYLTVAHYFNIKAYGKDGYKCKEAVSGEGACIDCAHIIPEMDDCEAMSSINPLYRITHPDYEPPHFEKKKKIGRPVMFYMDVSGDAPFVLDYSGNAPSLLETMRNYMKNLFS